MGADRDDETHVVDSSRQRRRLIPVADAFDEGRDLACKSFHSACYAPSSSMYFDQHGKVRACCQNTGGLLGDVSRQSIREIWESTQAGRLREALAVRDFSVGCGFCAWQAEDVGFSEFARGFDDLAPESIAPMWPLRMEFSMTNSCNLQCVMCNGDWSSSIRAHREGRPPLPEVYGDAFFEELEEFLPHLVEARFLGGEPFLGREPLRVMEMLADMDRPPEVSITTNGTQWSPRIERICERLPISFVVSLDGITKETYESIRVGADFDVVMDNLLRFRDYARRHGASVSIAHCLMRPNYHEFVELLRFAEAFGLDGVGVNTVLFPTYLSLFQLDPSELLRVVRELEDQDTGPAQQLGQFRSVWDEQLSALRARIARAQESPLSQFVDPWGALSALPLISAAEETGGLQQPDTVRFAVRAKNKVVVGPAGEVVRPIVEVLEGFEQALGRSGDEVLGRPILILPEVMSTRFGSFIDGPVIGSSSITATLEDSFGGRYEGETVFIDEGATLLIVVTIRRVT